MFPCRILRLNSRSPELCKGTHAVPNCNHLKFFKISFRIPKIPPIQPTSFGQFIRKLRLERQLQQRDLAKLIDASVQSIRNWEADRFLPGKESMAKLASFFQIDMKYLMNFDTWTNEHLLFFLQFNPPFLSSRLRFEMEFGRASLSSHQD